MSKVVTVTMTLPNGKRKYFRGATRKEAEAKRDAAKRDMAAGLDLTCNATVKSLAELWLTDYKRGVVRESTYLSLESIVNKWIIPELGNLPVKDVKPAHIQRLRRVMSGLKKSSQRSVLRIAKAIFTVGQENGMLLNNPCTKSVTPQGEDGEEKRPLTPEQEEDLLNRARGTRLYLFVLLGLKAGLRRGELLGLQWKDIDFETGMLSVRRSVSATKEHVSGELTQTLKTRAARRSIPLSWDVVSELRAARALSNSVFVITGKRGSFMTLSNLQQLWDKLTADLSYHVHPHLLRHTRITRWFEQGLDLKEVQYLAGHSTLKMTLEIYTHYCADVRLRETADKIQAVM